MNKWFFFNSCHWSWHNNIMTIVPMTCISRIIFSIKSYLECNEVMFSGEKPRNNFLSFFEKDCIIISIHIFISLSGFLGWWKHMWNSFKNIHLNEISLTTFSQKSKKSNELSSSLLSNELNSWQQ
jgi:hypothetical protein